ncbi:Phage minor structural protein GP20 [Slackia heliotrinireducens]|uniref:Scaffolding protein n=1 Tax=Slackia heliotrinireducens (strain ATCC 29202 / DSM 20476 / NCTC 11029 / RHS 1) TaxID=471855 RepID=C7N693_SLAHD|nr:hypothetical protein [Slackia heliotrinireducens]ACV22428.1 hypothetical protein Shel_14070 [Slackia heliotrinireducens DSM 20476]VEH00769.1 Phage minor structural protein GP20 [Slackia heliotrinireducens]
MKEKDHDSEETQGAQREDGTQEPQAQPVASGVDASAYEAQIVERDGRIKELEAQVAEAAKTAEATEALKSQIEELKAQGESDRIEFELRLAGVRNVKAARAILDEHDGDVAALKEAEPWLFADATHKQSGKTGLPNAGTSADEGKTVKRWRKLAGLDDSGDE